MSIYDCTDQGPYIGFSGKRVVVSVNGVAMQHYYGYREYGARADTLAEEMEAKLLVLQAHHREERLSDLAPRIKKNMKSHPVCKHIQFGIAVTSMVPELCFTVAGARGYGQRRYNIRNGVDVAWKQVLEYYELSHKSTKGDMLLLDCYKPAMNELITWVGNQLPTHYPKLDVNEHMTHLLKVLELDGNA